MQYNQTHLVGRGVIPFCARQRAGRLEADCFITRSLRRRRGGDRRSARRRPRRSTRRPRKLN